MYQTYHGKILIISDESLKSNIVTVSFYNDANFLFNKSVFGMELEFKYQVSKNLQQLFNRNMIKLCGRDLKVMKTDLSFNSMIT